MARSLEDFLTNFGRIMRPRMNMSVYKGNFQCACGKEHYYPADFDRETRQIKSVEILAEGLMRVICECPDNKNYISSVKINQSFFGGFKGFETLDVYRFDTQEEYLAFQYVINKLR